MDKWELMRARHSVRSYLDRPIEQDKREILERAVGEVNAEAGLHVQLFVEEPEAFDANAPHYGMFSGCRNYFAMVGPKEADEAIGYYGEKLVLLAQELGLNTCWVALTARKRKSPAAIEKGEKMPVVISLGYGETQGHPRKTKSAAEVSDAGDDAPEWYRSGLAAALKAPTATNQQRFFFTRNGSVVTPKATGGFYSDMDLGIVKLHFEIGAGKENFTWG